MTGRLRGRGAGLLLAALWLGGCHGGEGWRSRPVGDPERMAAELVEAREHWVQAPDAEDAIVWYGRRLAYLGRFEEAQRVYTRGLELHPDSIALLRHRGHRYLTLRRYSAAVADLSRAAALCSGHADQIEPDGMPNAAGVPRSTLQGNVFYHLGLAHFLLGEFPDARAAFEQCRIRATNDDMLCATLHWQWCTLRRLGKDAEAEALLAPVHENMEILENRSYHQLLLLYKGERDAEELLRNVRSDGPSDSALAFGIAHYWYVEGDGERARRLMVNLAVNRTNAFGCLAAEAELERLW